jgi:predicted lipoprotein with Yx(FWY)xxD motif
VCSSGCAGAWPPLLFTGSGTPTSSTQLPGKLTVVVDANGNQGEYNGHPLYTFASDTAPGQTNGEAVGGIWFVATPSLK